MKSAQKESLAVELHNGEVLHLGVANVDIPVSFVVEWTHRRQPAMHHVLDVMKHGKKRRVQAKSVL